MALEWAKVLQWFKPRPSLYFAVALASGLLLFSPAGLSKVLALDPILQSYGPWVGAAFLLSVALLVAHGLAWLFTSRSSPLRMWWHFRRRRGSLKDLSPEEKEILRLYLTGDTVSHSFEIHDGVVSSLVQKRILWRASEIASSYTTFPFNIQPWARKYLRKRPDVLR